MLMSEMCINLCDCTVISVCGVGFLLLQKIDNGQHIACSRFVCEQRILRRSDQFYLPIIRENLFFNLLHFSDTLGILRMYAFLLQKL